MDGAFSAQVAADLGEGLRGVLGVVPSTAPVGTVPGGHAPALVNEQREVPLGSAGTRR